MCRAVTKTNTHINYSQQVSWHSFPNCLLLHYNRSQGNVLRSIWAGHYSNEFDSCWRERERERDRKIVWKIGRRYADTRTFSHPFLSRRPGNARFAKFPRQTGKDEVISQARGHSEGKKRSLKLPGCKTWTTVKKKLKRSRRKWKCFSGTFAIFSYNLFRQLFSTVKQ